MKKIGRNDPCTCGSGKKFKYCCSHPDEAQAAGVRPVYMLSLKPSQPAHFIKQKPWDGSTQIAGNEEENPGLQEMHTLATLFTDGRCAEAATLAQAMIVRFPRHGFCWKVLGTAFKQMGRSTDALAPLQKAVELSPGDIEAHNNLGATLSELGRFADAEASYRRALQIRPDYAEAHCNLGVTLNELGRFADAEASYRQALQIRPDYAKAHHNLGITLNELGRFADAEASYQRALQIKPDYAEAHYSLGVTLNELGRLADAEASYRNALSLKPDFAAAHHALIFAMHRLKPDDGAAAFAQCRIFAGQFEKGIFQQTHQNAPCSNRKLKIGYVSGDFNEHPVAYFIEPVLANHDDHVVEVFCYYNHSLIDRITKRLMKYPQHWRSIAGLSDDQVTELVQRDGIDILVDLSGHTLYNRLLTFARKPAPVQVTWIGMPITTGLSAMDYRLTNKHIDPVGINDQYHSETLIRLSSSACFQPAELPPVNSLPALTNGHVTFSSFNEANKITPAVFALWARILTMLPDSRLMMICPEHAKGRINHEFMAHGIEPDRLILVNRLPVLDYLAMHNNVDIALDPFPYNGGTITRNSLWMGVPVLTLAGSQPISRVGSVLMSQLGLEAFAAESKEEYVQIALRWAHDLDGLAQIRNGLRKRVQEAPFSNVEGYIREVETAYRHMWRTWCAKQDACCNA